MRKTKPPALTSPWKIGFYVSLMLVFVSIGVAYFFINKFGVSWNWLDKNEWLRTLRGEGFVFELLPIIAVVAVSSMISYLVITRAVRKYKRYLDSGLDYKHLLVSLKEIGDLEDRSKIERLRNHPELKRLLLGLHESLETKTLALAERESEIERQTEEAVRAKEEELTNGFATECTGLLNMVSGPSGPESPVEPDISHPDLKRIAEAFQNASKPEPIPDRSELADSYGDLRKASDVLQNTLQEIANEMKNSSVGAKEIEEQLRSLASPGEVGSDRSSLDAAREEVRGVLMALRSLDELAGNLDVLSEEAKGVAISTALNAGSGEGTQDDLIRLAEEVKEIAARYKEQTKRFSEVSMGLRSSVGGLESCVGSGAGEGEADVAQTMASVSSKVSLWVERVVVLSDKISNLSQSYDLSLGSLPEAASNEAFEKTETAIPVSETADGVRDDEEFKFENLDRSQSLFGEPTAGREGETAREDVEPTQAAFVDHADESHEFSREPAQPEESQEISGEPAQPEEIQEVSGELRQPEESQEISGEPAQPEEIQEVSEKPTQPTDTPTGVPGLVTFTRQTSRPTPSVDSTSFESSRLDTGGDRVMPGKTEESTTKTPAHVGGEEDVVDLYTLGAVDYDPVIHG